MQLKYFEKNDKVVSVMDFCNGGKYIEFYVQDVFNLKYS